MRIGRLPGLILVTCLPMLGVSSLVSAAITTTTALSLSGTNTVTGDVTLSFRVSGCAPGAAPFESGTIQIFEGATSVYSFALSPIPDPFPEGEEAWEGFLRSFRLLKASQ